MSSLYHPTLLLLLVFFFVFFTVIFSPATVAAGGVAVKHLPGYEGPLPFELQTGYVGVGEEEEVQVFYYFVKSESNPSKDPLILWLTGGPGCSGLWSITIDNGPLRFDKVEYNGSLPTLSLNPYAWTKVANIIYLDLPVGTGFSYATTSRANNSDDIQAGFHGCQFVQKWLKENPEFISNDLYVGGESYAGVNVPIITQFISDGIEAGFTPWLNLKGYLLGNPITYYKEFNSQIPYAHGMGLISDHLYESLEHHCDGEYQDIDPNNLACLQDVVTFYQSYDQLYQSHILEPACHGDEASRTAPHCHNDVNYPTLLFGQKRSLKSREFSKFTPPSKPMCRDHWYNLLNYWANEQFVRDALHITKGTIEKWEYCSSNLSYTSKVESVLRYHEYLSKKNYRSLIYSGDHDPCVPFISTQAWIRSLNYSIVDDWRPWMADDQVGGYATTFSNGMTFATVKGGGHTVPESAPHQALIMFTKWIQNDGEYQDIDPNNLACLQDVVTFYQWYRQLYPFHMLEPACNLGDGVLKKQPGCYKNEYPQLFDQRRSLRDLQILNPISNKKCRDHWYNLMDYWANDQNVRNALHIRKGTIERWEFCSSNLVYTSNVESYHAYLSPKGYRSLIYSGDHDPCVTFSSTQAWIKSLNYSIVDDWRPWWVDDQVGGYTTTYSNGMTFATVKGGGHTVPESAPYQALFLFVKWIQNGGL